MNFIILRRFGIKATWLGSKVNIKTTNTFCETVQGKYAEIFHDAALVVVVIFIIIRTVHGIIFITSNDRS